MTTTSTGRATSRTAMTVCVGADAGAVITLQLAALVVLDIGQYATFSTVYIGFALCWSLCLSVLCDLQIRRLNRLERPSGADGPTTTQYRNALTQFALLSGTMIASLVIAVYQDGLLAFLGWAAVMLAIWRQGIRYTALASGVGRTAATGEALAIVTMAVALAAALSLFDAPVAGLLGAWAIHSVTSVIGYRARPLLAGSGLVSWTLTNRREVGALLAESTIMDLSSIGLPFLIAPFAGTTTMATYRASVSALFPIRIVINAARPRLVSSASNITMRRHAAIAGASVCVAVATAVSLPVLKHLRLPESSIVLELLPFTAWIGIAAGATFAWNVYYLNARGRLGHRRLFRARCLQSVTSLVGTLAAVIWFGQLGAIVAFAGSSLVAAVIWGASTRTNALAAPKMQMS